MGQCERYSTLGRTHNFVSQSTFAIYVFVGTQKENIGVENLTLVTKRGNNPLI